MRWLIFLIIFGVLIGALPQSGVAQVTFDRTTHIANSDGDGRDVDLDRLSSAAMVMAYTEAVTPENTELRVRIGVVHRDQVELGTAVAVPVTPAPSLTEFTVTALSSEQFVLIYGYTDDGVGVNAAIAGRVSGTTITWGQPTIFYQNEAGFFSTDFDADALSMDQFIVAYQNVQPDVRGVVRVGSVNSANTITFEDEVIFEEVTPYDVSVTALTSTSFALGWRTEGGWVCTGSISPEGIQFSPILPYAEDVAHFGGLFTLHSTTFGLVYAGTADEHAQIRQGFTAGELSLGMPYPFTTDEVQFYTSRASVALSPTRFVTTYSTGGNSPSGRVVLGSVEDGIQTGDPLIFDPRGANQSHVYTSVTHLDVNTFVVMYEDNLGEIAITIGTIDENSNVPTPTLQWARTIGDDDGGYSDTDADQGHAITSDDHRNIYVTGVFTDPDSGVDCGNGQILSGSYEDIFLAKYNRTGVCQWVISIGTDDPVNMKDGGLDVLYRAGYIYLTGYFTGTNVNFGNGILINGHTNGDLGSTDAFLAKYRASDGHCLWARAIGGTSVDKGYSLDLDVEGNIYLTGTLSPSEIWDFGNNILIDFNENSSYNGFLAKYDPAGICEWARVVGGSGQAVRNQAVTVNSFGVYITGSADGNGSAVDFGNGQTLINDSEDIFLAQFAPNGQCLRVRGFGGSQPAEIDRGYGLGTDSGGNIYLTGAFRGEEVDLGTGERFTSWLDDIFLSRFSPSLDGQWTRVIRVPAANGAGHDLAVRGNYIYLTGKYYPAYRDIDFGNGFILDIHHSGGEDTFLARYRAADGACQWLQTIPEGYATGNGVTVNRLFDATITGYVIGQNVDFGGILLSSIYKDAFVAHYGAPQQNLVEELIQTLIEGWVEAEDIEIYDLNADHHLDVGDVQYYFQQFWQPEE
ncbi:MAG: hypothetical protein D6675_13370 [Gemmatimonadetes bacterium]|nr:MAG: hypothetical protein D6675_13370 [Gemmatimonadota bacterium]